MAYELKEMTQKQRQELEELVVLLKKIKGRHTELVTVYIPSGFSKDSVVRQLETEAGTAENIKSKATRTAVVASLERIIRELKNYKQTSPNGMAAFCGNISEKEGIQDIQLWIYEPPRPLNIRLYRCDQEFIVTPLEEMLDVQEVYGLLVIDRQQATIGLLEGKQIKVIRTLTSGVPGKVRAGGQCLAPDTLIMKEDGEIIEIKEAHNPLLIVSQNFNIEKTEETPIIAKWENKKELFKITTCYPHVQIKASKEHTFFARTKEGIKEKTLDKIKEGDYLIMPEKINILSKEEQEIHFKPLIKEAWNMKKVNIPKRIDETFSRILGYYLGDGNYELDRIGFSEQRKEVAEFYKSIIDCYFNVNSRMKFRENKGYYQTRVGSRILAQLFKHIFNENNKTLNQVIPSCILKSPDYVIASFLSGFFDAEGYVSKSRVALGINNERLAKQIQFMMLRLGIIASINEYNNRKNPYSDKIRYTIAIDDIKSLEKFRDLINFTSKEKREKVGIGLKIRSNRNKIRQIVVNGEEVARIIRNSGLNTTQFRCPDFFVNKKQLSKDIFKKNIIDKIQNPELKKRLELFYLSNLIAVKIKKIESLGIQKTVDIETKNHNFIANGLIVHNSSQRFARITEGLAKEFFRRVSDSMKEIFFEMPKLKGILVGGPIPTKEEFLEEGQLVTKLKEKVMAVKDIGYVDEHGLKLLVEASEKDISEQEFIKEKEIIQRFFETLGKNKTKAVYGLERTRLALERGAVDTLLIAKALPKEEMKEFEEKAESIGSKVFIISTENQDGEQFFNLTKGVGAILRFALE